MPPIPLETLLAHVDGMRRLAHCLVRDPALAEDVAQDAVLVALSRGPRHDRNLRGWLNGIVRNVARTARRSAARRTSYERAWPARPPAPEPAAHAIQLAEQRRLLEAVEALPEVYRYAIWQRYFEDESPRVIAREAGIPVETVHTRLRRARALLRQALDAKHDGNRRAWALALAPVANTGSWWTLPALIGGALVTTKTKIASLGVLALLLAGGGWWMSEVLDRSPDGRAEQTAEPELAATAPAGAESPTLEGRLAARAAPLRAPEPPTTEGRYHGTLLDEQGRPVSGAWLEVVQAYWMSGDVVDLPRIVPDEDGRFSFDVADARGQVSVRIHSGTHAPQWGGRVHYVWPDRLTKLVLVPTVPLGVLVLDEDTGRPVVGGEVRVYGRLTPSPDALRSMRPVEKGTTNDEGRVMLRTRTGPGALVVQAEGYRTALLADLDVRAEGEERTVRVGRGGIVEGRVVDESGAAMAGVLIDVHGYPPFQARVTTDANGRFTLRNTPLSTDPPEPVLRYHLRLWTQVPGGDSQPRFFRVRPPSRAGETTEATLTWYAERPLAGRVRHADGRPAAGIAVTAKPRRAVLLNWPATPTTTDTQGLFRFEHCVPGYVRVEARHGGPTGAVLAERVVELTVAGATPDIELVLPGPASVDGPVLTVRLLTPAGEVLDEGAVSWQAIRGRGMTTLRAPIEKGQARLEEGVHADSLVWAEAPSWAPHAVQLTEADLAAGRLDLRFPGGVVEGRVIRRDGTPVQVALAATHILPRKGSTSRTWLSGRAEHRTDEAGRFMVRGIGDGKYALRVRTMEWRLIGGQRRVRAGERDVELVVGTESELHDLFIEAVVHDAETDAPLIGWHLLPKLVEPGAAAESDPVAVLSAVTGATSLYRTFDPVDPGVYDVVIPRLFGHLEARVAGVRVGDGVSRPRVTLTWDRGLAVTGRVLDGRSEPAAGVYVQAGGQMAVVREDGTYRVTGLDAGTVDVAVAGPYVEPQSQRVEVWDGEGGRADFRVTTGGAIRLLPEAAWRPRRGMVATVQPEGGGTPVTLDLTAVEIQGRRATSGGLVLPRLPPGRWRIEIDWDGERHLSDVVTVRDRETTKVHLSP